MKELIQHGYKVLLETNGSLYLEDVPPEVIKIVDVKCPGSGHGDSFMKWNLKCLNPADELKFVLTSYVDYAFAREFVLEHKLEDRIVHFSPVTSILCANDLAQWILEDGLDVRLSLQLHKLLDVR